MNVEAFLPHQAFSFLMGQRHDAFIEYAVRNDASRQEIPERSSVQTKYAKDFGHRLCRIIFASAALCAPYRT